jgi:hypothetical protein
MAPLAAVFVALAGVLHVYIFVLESAWWTRPKTWKRFGLTSQAEAETTRPLAYNQGFYNLFLAVGASLGLFFYFGAGRHGAGAVQYRVDGPRRRRAHDHRPWPVEVGADSGHTAADRVHPLPDPVTSRPRHRSAPDRSGSVRHRTETLRE